MSDEQRLHDALSGLVPEPPQAPDRAQAARDYARRRRGRLVGGAGGAVVAAVIVLPFVLTGGFERTPQHTTPMPGVVAGAFTCPNPSGTLEPEAPLKGPDTLPEGPIAARLCFNGGLPWQAPHDALLSGPDEVVSTINDLPTQPSHNSCPADLGPTWAILFQYPDGYTQLVRGRSFGCGGVSIGTITRGDRDSADDPLQLFQTLLWQQRESADPPAKIEAQPDCDHTMWGGGGGLGDGQGLTMMPVVLPQHFTEMVVCWHARAMAPWHSAPVQPVDLEVLMIDLNASASTGDRPSSTCRDGSPVRINVVNVWGDEIQFIRWCGVFYVFADQDWYWRPGPESKAIIDRLISGD